MTDGRRRLRDVLLVAAVALGIVVFGPRWCGPNLLDVGDPAPDFQLGRAGDPGGGQVRLADLAGRPAILFFWTAWCPHCKPMLPDLDRLAAENGEARVLAIHSDRDVDPEAVDAFARAYPHLWVTFDGDVILGRYRVQSFPTTYVLSPQGRICSAYPGRTTLSTLRSDLAECDK